MTHEHGAASEQPAQANFIGMLALVLIAVAVLSALIVLFAAMNAG